MKREDCIVCSEVFKIEGVPVSFDTNETVREFKQRISLLFNLDFLKVELTYNLKTLSDDAAILESYFQDKEKIILYLTSSDLSAPRKISLERMKLKEKTLRKTKKALKTPKKSTKKASKKKSTKKKATKKKSKKKKSIKKKKKTSTRKKRKKTTK